MMRGIILVLGLIFILSFTLVYAQPVDIATAAERLFDDLRVLFSGINIPLDPIFDNLIERSDFVMRVFFGILLFLLIFSALDIVDMIHDRKILNLVFSGIFTFLAMRAMPEQMLNFIIPVYETLFSTIFSLIPLLLVLFVSLKVRMLWAARLLWLIILVFFTIVFLSLGIPSFKEGLYFQGGVYFIIMVFTIFCTLFIRPLRRVFFTGKINELTKELENAEDIRHEMHKSNVEVAKAMKDLSSKK